MSNNNHQNSICAYAEPLISYVYGEIGAAEKSEFEAHLENCASCDSELKEFGFARTAVSEWRELEFDKLATPVFTMPTDSTKVQNAAPEIPRSRFADWRLLFSFKPALAMSALTIIIALFGIAAFVFNSKFDRPIAGNINDKELAQTIVSPTVEKKAAEKKEIIAVQNPDTTSAATTDAAENIEIRNVAPVKIAATKTSPVTPKNTAVKAVQTDARRNPKSKTAVKSSVPQLTETDDEEDDSVRLADLFDEIETR